VGLTQQHDDFQCASGCSRDFGADLALSFAQHWPPDIAASASASATAGEAAAATGFVEQQLFGSAGNADVVCGAAMAFFAEQQQSFQPAATGPKTRAVSVAATRIP